MLTTTRRDAARITLQHYLTAYTCIVASQQCGRHHMPCRCWICRSHKLLMLLCRHRPTEEPQRLNGRADGTQAHNLGSCMKILARLGANDGLIGKRKNNPDRSFEWFTEVAGGACGGAHKPHLLPPRRPGCCLLRPAAAPPCAAPCGPGCPAACAATRQGGNAGPASGCTSRRSSSGNTSSAVMMVCSASSGVAAGAADVIYYTSCAVREGHWRPKAQCVGPCTILNKIPPGNTPPGSTQGNAASRL